MWMCFWWSMRMTCYYNRWSFNVWWSHIEWPANCCCFAYAPVHHGWLLSPIKRYYGIMPQPCVFDNRWDECWRTFINMLSQDEASINSHNIKEAGFWRRYGCGSPQSVSFFIVIENCAHSRRQYLAGPTRVLPLFTIPLLRGWIPSIKDNRCFSKSKRHQVGPSRI